MIQTPTNPEGGLLVVGGTSVINSSHPCADCGTQVPFCALAPDHARRRMVCQRCLATRCHVPAPGGAGSGAAST